MSLPESGGGKMPIFGKLKTAVWLTGWGQVYQPLEKGRHS